MKRVLGFALFSLALVSVGLPPQAARAQAPDGSRVRSESVGVAPELAVGHVARYRVTYTTSQTSAANRTSSVVSITNKSGVTCSTSVDWRIGFAGLACTTVLTLGPGQTGEHCSRPLPGAVSVCNRTCAVPLTTYEGSGIVGSNTVVGCQNIAVSARTYHTTGSTDSAVAAATDAKVVRIGVGNSGD